MKRFSVLLISLNVLIMSSIVFGQSLSQKATKVLIFSAPFGSGHNTAANRMKETIEAHFHEKGVPADVQIKNTMEFAPQWYGKLALAQFSGVQTNAPILYTWMFEDFLNKAYKVDSAAEMGLYKNLFISLQKMDQFISEQKPDVVISTWPGSTEALLKLKQDSRSIMFEGSAQKIPLGHVQTDNASKDLYFQLFARDKNGQIAADAVFVPSQEVYKEYAEVLGMKNIIFTGMPLILKSELSSQAVRAEEIKQAKTDLGFDPHVKTIMIEAGKNGAANYPVVIASLARQFKREKLNIIAACGDGEKNKRLVEALVKGVSRNSPEFQELMSEMKELYQPRTVKNFLKKGSEAFTQEKTWARSELEFLIENGIHPRINVKTFGFGPLNPLRAASDLVITKPGGLSTAELGADARPMIIMQEYASGEALPNGPLFEKQGLAIVNKNISVIGEDAMALLSNDQKLQDMYQSSINFRSQFNIKRALPFVDPEIGLPLCSKIWSY